MEYCNPLNLNYKYQHFGDKAHREGADPTLLMFKGKYYLFVSMSAGFYYSDDLVNWNWHENRSLDMYNYIGANHHVVANAYRTYIQAGGIEIGPAELAKVVLQP